MKYKICHSQDLSTPQIPSYGPHRVQEEMADSIETNANHSGLTSSDSVADGNGDPRMVMERPLCSKLLLNIELFQGLLRLAPVQKRMKTVR